MIHLQANVFTISTYFFFPDVSQKYSLNLVSQMIIIFSSRITPMVKGGCLKLIIYNLIIINIIWIDLPGLGVINYSIFYFSQFI